MDELRIALEPVLVEQGALYWSFRRWLRGYRGRSSTRRGLCARFWSPNLSQISPERTPTLAETFASETASVETGQSRAL
jgi:hypothetical protein